MSNFFSKSQILKDTFFRFAQAALKQVYQILATFYGVYVLGMHDFGEYAYIISIILILSIFGDFGISLTVSKLLSESRKNINLVFKDIFSFLIVASFFLAIFCFIVIFLILKQEISTAALCSVIVFITPLCSFFEGANRGLHDFNHNAYASLVSSTLGIITLFALTKAFGVDGILISQLSFLTVFLFISSSRTINYFSFKNPKLSDKNKSAIKYAFTLGIASLGQFMYTKADIFVLGQFGMYDEISIYEMIDRVFIYLILPFGLIGQVLAPRVINSEVFRERYSIISAAIIALTTSISILLMFIMERFSSEIYKSMGFSQGLDSQVNFIFLLLLILLPIRSFAIFQTQAFLAPLGYANIIAKTTVFFGLINIILDFILIELHGFKGVFISTIIVITLNTLFQTIYFLMKVKCERNKCIN